MGRELRWNWKELEEDKLWSEYVVLNFSIKEKEEITNKNYRHGNNISKQQFQLEMCIIGMIVIYIPFYHVFSGFIPLSDGSISLRLETRQIVIMRTSSPYG